jgi:hypothetical protein
MFPARVLSAAGRGVVQFAAHEIALVAVHHSSNKHLSFKNAITHSLFSTAGQTFRRKICVSDSSRKRNGLPNKKDWQRKAVDADSATGTEEQRLAQHLLRRYSCYKQSCSYSLTATSARPKLNVLGGVILSIFSMPRCYKRIGVLSITRDKP